MYLNEGCPIDPRTATRADVERVAAWINSQPYKSSTKGDLKITLKKLVQYGKYGSCYKAPVPEEAMCLTINTRCKDSRVRPDFITEAKLIMRIAQSMMVYDWLHRKKFEDKDQ
ncbi:MAG: hypothetical protein H5T34_03980 [Candidatus Methanomethyliales bacterium]|nr:hypothetical protein [Candidatus Methanomethylicales archaeon]